MSTQENNEQPQDVTSESPNFTENRKAVLERMRVDAHLVFPLEAPYHYALAYKSADIQADMQDEIAKEQGKDRWVSYAARGFITGRVLAEIAYGNEENIQIEVDGGTWGRRETNERRKTEKKRQLREAAQRVVEAAKAEHEPYVIVDEHLKLDSEVSRLRGVMNAIRRNLGSGVAIASLPIPIPGSSIPFFMARGKINSVAQKETFFHWNPQTRQLDSVRLRPQDEAFQEAYKAFLALKPKVRLTGRVWKEMQDMYSVRPEANFAGLMWNFKKLKGMFFKDIFANTMRAQIFALQDPREFAERTESAAYYRLFRDIVRAERAEQKRR